MAVLAKKIHIKNSAGTEQTVTLYSTTAEIATASGYTFQLVDGVTAYAALVPTNHARATSGRVLKNGTTYAWGYATPAPAYAYQLFTTAGSGTFTVPSGVTKLRVTCVGGGVGSILAADISWNRDVGTHNGISWTRGGTTTFGSVSAASGTYATGLSVTREGYSCNCGRDSCGTCYDYPSYTFEVSKGYHNGTGYFDGYDVWDGGAAVPLVNYAGTTIASVGAGGRCDAHGEEWAASGASGYRTVSTISVTSGQTISYTVGAGGPGSRYGSACTSWCSSNGHSAEPGSAGGILVEYGSGIE